MVLFLQASHFQCGVVDCDPYSQALAKIERWHELDRVDVRAMLERNLVDPGRLRACLEAISPQLSRFPAVDPPAFRRNLEELLDGPPLP